MKKLLVWDHVCSVPTDVRTLTFALKTDFAVSIVEDMVAARAFVGSGRSFEFYGSEREMRNMMELENNGYVERAPDSDGTASESRWYLTRKTASLLEAFRPEMCKFHMFFSPVRWVWVLLPFFLCLPSFLPICLHSSSSSFLPPPPPPNSKLQISVSTAGPQLRAPNLSGHCRTSTVSSASQWALPDLNRELQISVGSV